MTNIVSWFILTYKQRAAILFALNTLTDQKIYGWHHIIKSTNIYLDPFFLLDEQVAH